MRFGLPAHNFTNMVVMLDKVRNKFRVWVIRYKVNAELDGD
jgi:hypothetical protein